MGKDAIVLTKSAYQLESSDNFTVYTTQEHGSTVGAPQSVIDAVNALGPTAISSVGSSGEKTSLEDGACCTPVRSMRLMRRPHARHY
ncbi:hypothetical protein HMPREF9233_01035 [Actinobaculum massiliense ACS-171-V-Col2]|uniref:Uncharacterized protein n=1 Tax=Actinobaculum massiliense ACS-171-V-Col2 TaxID=883066 RepID=K9EDF4_9ACTO|nr:hypothetical protein HMPREF9233_01035 [Actinobaculum massiliense ACS-171-V-Col2]